MALSNNLIRDFVEMTSELAESGPQLPKTVYGTAVVNSDGIYVRVDGSSGLTPVAMSTDAKNGDRVLVSIENHEAYISGNLTSPGSGRTATDLYAEETDENGVTVVTGELRAAKEYVDTLIAGDITADSLVTEVAKIGDLEVETAKIAELETEVAKIDSLETEVAKIDSLETEVAKIDTLDTLYATIDFSNIGIAAIEELFTQSGIIEDLVVEDQHITGALAGVTISGDLIEGNTVKADKLVVLGEDGLYYKLNVDALGETTASSDEKYQNGLDGSAIIAHSITADRVTVSDIVAFGATIGGFHITAHSLYSGAKASAANTTSGIFLGDDGQIAIGDATNFLKYYKDGSVWKLDITAQSIKLGTGKTVEQTISESIDDISIGGKNLYLGTLDFSNYNNQWLNFSSWTTDANKYLGFIVKSRSAKWNGLAQDIPCSVGDVFTISFYGKVAMGGCIRCMHRSSLGNVTTGLNILGGNFEGSSLYWVNIGSDGTAWKKYWATLQVESSEIEYIQWGVENTVDNCLFSICGFKLEKGNKVTDWTPAPEDTLASLESAKEEARTSLQATKDELISRGEQLVVNGNGSLGDNTNFPDFTYDGTESPEGATGSFTRNSIITSYSTEFFPIDTSLRYLFEFDAKTESGADRYYSMIACYDIDKRNISAQMHMHYKNTLTFLTQDLKPGDTVVHFNDLTNWRATTATHQRAFIFWNYTNSLGYTYPPETYSRNYYSNIYSSDSSVNKTAKTITLTKAWTGPTIPANTKVSQNHSGSGHPYNPLSNAYIPTEWTHYAGSYYGVDYGGGNPTTKFVPGTAYGKVAFRINNDNSNDRVWITNLSVKTDIGYEITSNIDIVNESIDALEEAQNEQANDIYNEIGDLNAQLNGIEETTVKTEASIQLLNDMIQSLVIDGSGESMMTQVGDRFVFDFSSILNQIKANSDAVGQTESDISGIHSNLDGILQKASSITLGTYTEGGVEKPYIELGSEGSVMKVRITNTEIDFVAANGIPAYISTDDNGISRFNIDNANVEGYLKVGNYVWLSHDNGNLGLVYRG